MMAPRDLIPGTFFSQSNPTPIDVASDLQTELRRTQNRLVDAENTIKDLRYQNAMLKSHIAVLKSESDKPVVVPIGDEAFGYECPRLHCHAGLNEDFAFCPGCGSPIDWRTYADPDSMKYGDVDAYDRRFDR